MDLLYTAHVPAGDGPHPTIFALHGWGASAHDLLGLAPLFGGGAALVLCPQGPVQVPVGPGVPPGHGWFPISAGGPLDVAAFDQGRRALGSFVDEASELFPIDSEHTIVLGFSQGGVMAYDLALHQPERFAGLVALSSWLPADLMNRIPRDDAQTKLPVMVMHGTEDPMIPVTRARESRDRLLQLGLDPVYKEYKMQHEIHPDALRDLMDWLVERL